MRCHLSDDVQTFLAEAGPFLESRPVEHNLLLTLSAMRLYNPEPSRWVWVTDDAGRVLGAAVQSPVAYRAALSLMPSREIVEAVVERLATVAPDLPGIVGDAAVTAAFAGAWTERLGVPGRPLEAQRLYRLGQLIMPTGVPGELRAATKRDVDLLVDWWLGFDEETMLERPAFDDQAAVMEARIENELVWMWEVDGVPTSMALHTIPTADAVRIGLVYTPPSQRGHGYAAACVGHLCQRILAGGVDHCLLYAQLTNPTSNAVYRRLGFAAIGESLIYAFG